MKGKTRKRKSAKGKERKLDISKLETFDDYYEAIGLNSFRVVFQKKDLSMREMTASFDIATHKPSFVRTETKTLNCKLISCLCLDDPTTPAWRSITIDSIQELTLLMGDA